MDSNKTYPIAIIESRYSGVYEGGKWHAIPNYAYVISTDEYQEYIQGDDGGAFDFWCSKIAVNIGIGDTPELALSDMRSKVATIEDED